MLVFGVSFVARGFAPQPTRFDFVATGLVEAVSPLWGGRCTVQIAVYRWKSLGPGLELADAPEEGDRYTVKASGETCQAVTVAGAATGNHLEFSAGSPNRWGDAWYFTEQPSPALGCLAPDDWVPPPEPR